MTAYAPTYGPPPGDPTNVVGARVGAWFIDLFVYLVLVVGAIAASGTWEADVSAVPEIANGDEIYCDIWYADNDGFCSYSDGELTTLEFDAAWVTGAFLLNFVGYVIIQGTTGGSLGKLAVGLRVVDVNGRQAGFGRSLARTLLWVVDGIVCGFPVVGGIVMVSATGHRRVGDMVAGTYVVRKHHVGQPIGVPGQSAPFNQPYGQAGAYPQPGGFAAPPSGAWQPPSVGQPPSAAPTGFSAPPTTAEPTPGEGPTWDAARNAYIQYDRAQSAWVQWDEPNQQWRPIDQ